MSLLKTKNFNFFHVLILSGIVAVTTFFITNLIDSKDANQQLVSASGSSACNVDVKRLNGLKYIKPIMFVDEECESDNLVSIKQNIVQIINRYKTTGDLTSASVYLRDYKNSSWTSVDDDQKYDPGSLLKVPVLITILKMNEKNPGFLNQSFLFEKKYVVDKNPAFLSKSIEVGKSYTVRELLNYMIKYSDNNATILLESHMELAVFQKLFEDFGLKVPSEQDTSYLISAKEYSFFMRAIYNAAYLTIHDSEFAAELLTECEFKDGILKGMPSNVAVAHKFGETGNNVEKQLHESAIVYLDGNPYLLTVMTRGKAYDKLSEMIKEVSQAVYNNMNGSATASTM